VRADSFAAEIKASNLCLLQGARFELPAGKPDRHVLSRVQGASGGSGPAISTLRSGAVRHAEDLNLLRRTGFFVENVKTLSTLSEGNGLDGRR
jgi:hypothetical protein